MHQIAQLIFFIFVEMRSPYVAQAKKLSNQDLGGQWVL